MGHRPVERQILRMLRVSDFLVLVEGRALGETELARLKQRRPTDGRLSVGQVGDSQIREMAGRCSSSQLCATRTLCWEQTARTNEPTPGIPGSPNHHRRPTNLPSGFADSEAPDAPSDTVVCPVEHRRRAAVGCHGVGLPSGCSLVDPGRAPQPYTRLIGSTQSRPRANATAAFVQWPRIVLTPPRSTGSAAAALCTPSSASSTR